jgi:hypothetical protein
MKKNFKFLLLAPLLMAILCESDDYTCGLSEPESYIVNVENVADNYDISETFWLNSEVSSELFNYCNATNEQEIIVDNSIFIDGLFVLKLNNSLAGLNAEVSLDFNVTYDLGDAFNGNYCIEALEYLPKLSDDNLTYKYRFGLSINAPGDYCIVNARNSFFNTEQENNDQIFEPYNTLNNTIKFTNCGNTYTRNGTQDYYFFTVNE